MLSLESGQVACSQFLIPMVCAKHAVSQARLQPASHSTPKNPSIEFKIIGLLAFSEAHPGAKLLVVSQDLDPRLMRIARGRMVSIVPWRLFLECLWAGELIDL